MADSDKKGTEESLKWKDVTTGEDREFNIHTDWSLDHQDTLAGRPPAEEILEVENARSEAEEKARSSGWLPKNEFEGNADDWVDYKTFNDRGELMSRISKQSKLIKKYERKQAKTDEAIAELKKHQDNIAQIEYNRALQQLKAEKANALEAGDHTVQVEIDERMAELKEAKAQEEQARKDAQDTQEAEATGGDPIVREWLENPKNSWYHQNVKARNYADYVTKELMDEGDFTDSEDLLAKVEDAVAQKLPEVFGKKPNTRKRTQNPVNEPLSTRQRPTQKSRFSEADLSPSEKKAGTKFVKLGMFPNLQAYIDNLEKHGMIGD